MERSKENEVIKVVEREVLMKFGYVIEEVDKSSRKVIRVVEQFDVVQIMNIEFEVELRRLKVQLD